MTAETVKAKILYIEDEALTRMLMVRQLRLYFSDVYEAGNGREGFEIFMETQPDIVITDLSMPHLDGFQLVDKIRGQGGKPKFIITTAFREETCSLKDCEILFKPISFADVYSCVTRLLNCQ
ncbi:response regulator [Geovibrio thiophilus]|uniref:Response regulator n=1 Tax=Geovibrio thiophilus TaxID=139438 RepID=A0A3R5YZZ4_9BACT|nr:response regulator [Geovibrio thiophilus]QAR33663.1 response regulator [Geovibrio thiophilus]